MQIKPISVESEQMGKIFRCCHGAYHIQLRKRGITLHFSEDEFLEFAGLVKQMYSKLFDEGLAELFKEEKDGEG